MTLLYLAVQNRQLIGTVIRYFRVLPNQIKTRTSMTRRTPHEEEGQQVSNLVWQAQFQTCKNPLTSSTKFFSDGFGDITASQPKLVNFGKLR